MPKQFSIFSILCYQIFSAILILRIQENACKTKKMTTAPAHLFEGVSGLLIA